MSFLRNVSRSRPQPSTKPSTRRRPSVEALEERSLLYGGNGLQFNIIPTAAVSAQVLAGMQEAANQWSSMLSDDIIVNINIDFTNSLPAGALGQTFPANTLKSLTDVKNALTADRTSLDDITAVAHLPAGSSEALYTTNFNTGVAFLDTNATDNNSVFNITRANAKAMGLRAANDPSTDGTIRFNNAGVYDFDRSNGIAAGRYDFVGVAVHEIGHLLGFVSGADEVDFKSKPNGAGYNAGSDQDNQIVARPLDLFRQSAASLAAGADFDLRADAASKFFSLDHGATQLATFSTGAYNGDGRGAGHWKDNLDFGIMDPSLATGEYGDVTRLDTRALDAIGWNLAMDYGDAPAGVATMLADNGPRHVLFSPSGLINDPKGAAKVFLGAGVESDLNGQPGATAKIDNDDGIAAIPPLVAGATVHLTVVSSASVSKPAVLNYFVDFNQNGVLNDPGEAFTATLTSPSQLVPIVIPAGAVIGTTLARFRISSAGNLGPTGPANDGEVEDYIVTITAPHAPQVASVTTFEGTLSGAISVTASPGEAVTHFKISNILGGTLFKNDGVTPLSSGSFITLAEGLAGLRFLPAANSLSPGHFDVEVSQDGLTTPAQSGKATSTITITAATHLQIAGVVGGSQLAVNVDLTTFTGTGKLTASNGAYYNLNVKSGTRQGSVVTLQGTVSPPGSSVTMNFDLIVDSATGFIQFSYKGAKGLLITQTTVGLVQLS